MTELLVHQQAAAAPRWQQLTSPGREPWATKPQRGDRTDVFV